MPPDEAVPTHRPGIAERSLLLTREALTKLRLGDVAAAQALIKLALAADAKNPYAYVVLARILRLLGRPEEAAQAATTALKLERVLKEALIERSLALSKLGRYREAADDASTAIRLDDRSAAAYLARARARRGLGDETGAREDEARAAALAGSSAPENKQRPARRGLAAGAAVGVALLLLGGFRVLRASREP